MSSVPRVSRDAHPIRTLTLLGLASWALYAIVVQLGASFSYGVPDVERPIPFLLALFTVLFALYLLALRTAVRCERAWPLILTFAAAFRILMLFTEPILEIDIYRYVWDGRVVASGVNPYRYSPAQVSAASPHPSSGGDGANQSAPEDLQRLAALTERDPPAATVLSRIHFAELTTVYPPVSQAVFAASALTTPAQAGVMTRLVVMKAWLVVFDLLTLLVMAKLLRDVGWPVGWSLAWGWCPLVVKEFGNSGHLDSIAVCLSVMAVWFAVRGLFLRAAACSAAPHVESATAVRRERVRYVLAAAALLALATGAKLYPVVLAPLLIATTARRCGWRTATICGVLYAALSGFVLSPMLTTRPTTVSVAATIEQDNFSREAGKSGIPGPYVERTAPIPSGDTAAEEGQDRSQDFVQPIQQTPRQGLHAFLSRWKMNDFLFLILESNLQPTDAANGVEPWFAVIPSAWRQSIVGPFATSAGLDTAAASFALARAATAILFTFLALRWAWTASTSRDPGEWLSAAFLTLAWFWLLSPTQNPWYWTWALPLIPFARCRAWLAVSGLVMLYYLRFWLIAHWPDTPVAGMPYDGGTFFNYVVVWLEYGPWFAVLAVEAMWNRTRRSSSASVPGCPFGSIERDDRIRSRAHE